MPRTRNSITVTFTDQTITTIEGRWLFAKMVSNTVFSRMENTVKHGVFFSSLTDSCVPDF
jgi:hypothetical protein